jgi:hypothetical protein
MSKKPCVHEYLADSEVGKVLICRDCGVVHLHLQNISMLFDAEQFAAFADMTHSALKKMHTETAQSSLARPKLTVVH